MSSVFDIIHRDTLPDPLHGSGAPGSRSSLDAGYLNRLADALVAVETYAQNAVTVEARTARSSALSPVIQRWMVSYRQTDPRLSAFSVSLPLSPAFLEDLGLIPPQNITPTNPQVSLARSIGSSWPAYNLTTNQYGAGNAATLPIPGWVAPLYNVPLLRTSARLIGATGSQAIHLENVQFFDAGSGVSPRMSADVRFATPDHRTTTLPSGYYELTLLAMNWVN